MSEPGDIDYAYVNPQLIEAIDHPLTQLQPKARGTRTTNSRGKTTTQEVDL